MNQYIYENNPVLGAYTVVIFASIVDVLISFFSHFLLYPIVSSLPRISCAYIYKFVNLKKLGRLAQKCIKLAQKWTKYHIEDQSRRLSPSCAL